MKAMAELGYAAVNVGEEDLRLGLDYLKYVSDFTGVPLLSANLVDSAGAPVFQEYVLRPMRVGEAELTAAVVGVISTEFKEKIESLNPGLVVNEYKEGLARLVEELREKSDLLIVLAHAGEQEAVAIAGRFPRVDLIVSSHVGDDPISIPLSEGETPVLFAGKKGMHVGAATFCMENGRAKFSSYSVQKLDGTFGDSPRMLALIEEYQQMIMAERLLEKVPRIKHERAKFTGDDACKDCHSLPAAGFQKSGHAHAFDALVAKKHEYDPECVSCHVIGFGYESGFISPDKTPELRHVGCENCHGPGGGHIENPTDEQYGEVAQDVCESCHTPDHSPGFDYSEGIKKVRHDSPSV